MTRPLDVRPLTADQVAVALSQLGMVFGDAIEQADRDAEASVFEVDRSLATFDGDAMVGTLGTYSFDMSVPGGSLPVAGTTWVSVSPTHRRRGVLRGMMRAHLDDIAERGEPLAALWASEPAIYGRFGYGPAIEQHRTLLAVDGALGWLDTAPPAPDVTLIPLEEAAQVLAPIHETVRRRRAGLHARTEAWWRFTVLSTRTHAMGGASTKQVAVAHDDGRPVAYAVYGTDGRFDDTGRPAGTLTVTELAGVDAAAEGSMWRYLADHDLIRTVSANRMPVDGLLPLLLTDSRRVRRHTTDALHVRVVDVAAALQGRSYAASTAFTVEVVDDLLDHNDGIWRVEVAPEGSLVEVARDVTTPDLRMPVTALGALYMGDVSPRRLAAAGLIEVNDPAVVPSVHTAFAAEEAGWAPEVW